MGINSVKILPIMKYLFNLLLVFFALYVNSLVGQGLSSHVDEFSGALQTSENPITVSGPNGEAFPVVFGYSGNGIGVGQNASTIGLGWNLNVPQITRFVKGVPDDAYEQALISTSYDDAGNLDGERKVSVFYGPVYFNQFPDKGDGEGDVSTLPEDAYDIHVSRISRPSVTTFEQACEEFLNAGGAFKSAYEMIVAGSQDYHFEHRMDVFQTSTRLNNLVRLGIDFDDYFVNAPGLSGALEMKFFEVASLMEGYSKVEYYDYIGQPQEETFYDIDVTDFTGKPQFLFSGARGVNVTNAHIDQEEDRLQNILDYSTSSLITGHASKGFNSSNSSFTTNQELVNGFYVRYFTNEEIVAGLSVDEGFIEVPNYTRVSNKLIGAIQVTNPEGVTYHFSLPEYVYKEDHSSFLVNNNGEPSLLSSESKFYTPSATPNAPLYAKAWKLIAITGPNFIDENNNGLIDDSDQGYFIKFSYGLPYSESTSRATRIPISGLNYDIEAPPAVADLYQFEKTNSKVDYKKTGSFSKFDEDYFFLKKVETKTEAAIFSYGYRKDAQDENGIKPLPRLEQISLFPKPLASSFSGSTYDLAPPSGGGISSGQLYRKLSNGELSGSLKSVQLVQDYSLANGFTGNSGTTPVVGAGDVYNLANYNDPIEIPSSFNYTLDAGKLTLKSIESLYVDGAIDLGPKEFVYSSNNPDYNQNKIDNWGYYKSDASALFGNYTSAASAQNLDAWMLTKINHPNGTITEFSFEPNTYYNVAYAGDRKDIESSIPQFSYTVESAVESADYINSSGERVLEFEITLDGSAPTELLNTGLSKEFLVGLRFNGNCRAYIYPITGFSWLGTNGANAYQPYINQLSGTEILPSVYAFCSDCPESYVGTGVVYQNMLFGGSQFRQQQSNTTTYHNNLVSYSLVPGQPNKLIVELIEPIDFKEKYEYPGGGNPLKVSCEDCPNPSGNNSAYDYSQGFQSGYVTIRPWGIAYGGGIRVSKVEYKGLDEGENIQLEMVYSRGRATSVPDRFHPIAESQTRQAFKGMSHLSWTQRYVDYWPEFLYANRGSADPMIMAPMVYYENVEASTFVNQSLTNSRSTEYHGLDFINVRSKSRRVIKDLGPLNDYLTYIELEDHRHLFGMPHTIESVDAGRTIRTNFDYQIVSDVSEVFMMRSSEGVADFGSKEVITSTGSQTYYSWDNVSVDNFTTVYRTFKYNVSKKEVVDLFSGIVTREETPNSALNPLSNTYLESMVTNSVKGTISRIKMPSLAYESNPSLGSRYLDPVNQNQLSLTDRTLDLINDFESQSSFSNSIPVIGLDNVIIQDRILPNSTGIFLTSQSFSAFKIGDPLINRSSVTMIHANGAVAEGKDELSGIRSSARLASDGRLIVSASNSGYFSSFYQSFEDDFTSHTAPNSGQTIINVFPGGGHVFNAQNALSTDAHSGSHSLALPAGAGTTRFEYQVKGNFKDPVSGSTAAIGYQDKLLESGFYSLRFWVKVTDIADLDVDVQLTGTVLGSSYSQSNSASLTQDDVISTNSSDWQLLEYQFEVPEDFSLSDFKITIQNAGVSGEVVLVDDIMLRPITANIQAVLYDEYGRAEYEINGMNLYQRYEYDAMSRVIKVYQEFLQGEVLVNEKTYYHEKY